MLPRLVLIGLGNPGSRYHATRHNVGFRVVDRLAAAHDAEWTRPRLSYESAEIDLGDFSILLAKPFAYMNLSGEAVVDLQAAGLIDPAGILVVTVDRLIHALAVGRIAIVQCAGVAVVTIDRWISAVSRIRIAQIERAWIGIAAIHRLIHTTDVGITTVSRAGIAVVTIGGSGCARLRVQIT